ncbi:hypothetical protein PUMCH_000601 [Australozyma saopauloensis]|uniref:Uncharacterized protein n=1 Tax=Australozyma saopauloensis TaxID=291208 RepID=A0AAX4H4B2_9ASCO|nr:hypothetical protein PUMCH_000601 [[Candida] saopauloensis]
MDELYLQDKLPKLGKPLAVLVIFKLLKIKNAAALAAFFTLHPHIRRLLRNHVQAAQKDPATVERRINKSSNLISAILLYAGVSLNPKIPKDYIVLYLIELYYGSLNTPRSPFLVSPTTARRFKLSNYSENGWVHWLYRNKHYVLFPLIYAQLLSNYLTPTQYKLNQRYLSSTIKNWMLNPIWRNFHMGRTSKSILWLGLGGAFLKHCALLMAYFLLSEVKSKILVKYFQKSDMKQAFKDYVLLCVKKTKSIALFVYGISLTSMALLAVTLPLLTAGGIIHKLYTANPKLFIKNYIKFVGAGSALLAMLVAVPRSEHLSAAFFNGINGYLLNLIVLSKWRILKENHPWFTILRVGTWERIESLLLSYVVWETMNLNDTIRDNDDADKMAECRRLQDDRLIRVVDRIMT